MSQPPHPPGLDPEQFVGGTPAGDDDPHAFASNDQSDTEHAEQPEQPDESTPQGTEPQEES